MLTERKSLGAQALGYAIGTAKKARHAYVTLSLEQAESVKEMLKELADIKAKAKKEASR